MHAQGTPFGWNVVMAPTLSGEYTALSVLDIDEIRSLYDGSDDRGGFFVVQGERGVVRDNLDFGAEQTGTPPYTDLYLDFGVTFTSTEPAGYSLVEYTTPYNPYTRWGWTAGTDRYGWNSGTGGALLEDYVDTADSTFAADVPSGTYDVTVTLGGPGRVFDQMRVSLEGTPVATLTAPAGQTVTATYQVAVTDGHLTVRFDDQGGQTPKVGINAITVVRAPDSLSLSVSPNAFSEGAGAGAATGTVTRTGDTSQPVTVSLTSSDTTEATVPATVTIPAGSASATFAVAAVDDAVIDGTQTVTLAASAAGYNGGSAPASVTDDDIPPFLTVAVSPATFGEGAGASAATGTVTRSGPLTGALTVTLTSSDTTEATIPATVTIPAGQASATFAVAAVNDQAIDGTQSVTVRGAAAGFTDGTAAVSVTDNDVPLVLTLSVSPATFGEGAGASAATVTVTRNGDLGFPLTVTLTSSDTSEATVPATVTIPAGAASRTFAVAAVNDTLPDGTQTVTLTAASGSVSQSKTVSVTDDEPAFTTGKFDFGTATSAAAAGYTRVGPGTTFTPAVGYGWTAGTIGAADRGATASDVNRDFNSTADGTFAVNVANGTYSVTLTIGDATTRRDKMAVYLEGNRVVNNLTTSAGQFYRQTFTVTVTDGQLTLRLADGGGSNPEAVINALEFTRIGN
jgi:fibronectin type 3 domain-containing protein